MRGGQAIGDAVRWFSRPFVAGVAAFAFGCATADRKPRIDAATLVREAEAEVDRGCYLCLRSAAEKYERAIAAGSRSVDLAAAGAWTLLAVRERELGLRASDALERARAHVVARAMPTSPPAGNRHPEGTQDPNALIDAYVRIARSLAPLREGVSTEATADAAGAARELEGGDGRGASTSSRATRAAPLERPDPPPVALVRQRAENGADRAASYLVQSLDCSSYSRPGSERARSASATEPVSSLMHFLAASCRNRADPARDASALAKLLETEPRFHEAHYFLGRLDLADRKLVSAEREFLAAADGLPIMTAAWAMLGSTRVLMEEYDWAAADYARALGVEPEQREALLGQARALNLAGRFEEAIVPAQRLLDLGNWYVSDANYWLAFSELQLGRLQEADAHSREAKRTNPMNGDTARLVGLVAHRRDELQRARGEFELAVSRNPADCESHLHLGMIHGQEDRFGPSVTSFVKARDCFASAAESAAARRGEIEASSLPESRKQVALGRLARRISGYRSAQAGASLGAAEGETQRGAYEQALVYLAEAVPDPQLAGRVGELRTRINALRSRR